MRLMPTQLHCAECNEMFEVSNEIADAMHRWREQSGDPFTCGACAGVDDIYEQEIQETSPTTNNRQRSL